MTTFEFTIVVAAKGKRKPRRKVVGLTSWFPLSRTPSRPGWYQVQGLDLRYLWYDSENHRWRTRPVGGTIFHPSDQRLREVRWRGQLR